MKRSLMVLLVLSVTGCSGNEGPETVEVSGTVKLNGKPTAGLDVTFISKDFTSFGRTDTEGKYKLTKGAVPGSEYKVCISNEQSGSTEEDIASGEDAGQAEAQQAGDEEGKHGGKKKKSGLLIPSEYSDPQLTKLTYKVPEDGTESANFDIPVSK